MRARGIVLAVGVLVCAGSTRLAADDAARLALLRGEAERWKAEEARAGASARAIQAELDRVRGMRDHLAGRAAADRTGEALAQDAKEMRARAADEGLKALTAAIGVGFDFGASKIESAGEDRVKAIAAVSAHRLVDVNDPLVARDVRLATVAAMKAARAEAVDHAQRAVKAVGAIPEIVRSTAGAETGGETSAARASQATGLAIDAGRHAVLHSIELLSSADDTTRAQQKTGVKLLALTAGLVSDLRTGKTPDEILQARGEEWAAVAVEYGAAYADNVAGLAKRTPMVGQAVAIEQTLETTAMALLAWRASHAAATHLEQNAGRYEEAFASLRNRTMALEIQLAKAQAAARKAKAHAAGLAALADRLSANPSVAAYPALTSLPGADVPVPAVPLGDSVARPAASHSAVTFWDRVGGVFTGAFGVIGSAASLVVYVGERDTGRAAMREDIAAGKGLLAKLVVEYGDAVGGRANLREEATERGRRLGSSGGGGGGGGGSSGGGSSGSFNEGPAYQQLKGIASSGW